ncbi:JmjC domain-containing protein [Pseudomonas aeruginosa]
MVSSAYLAFGKKSSFRCHWDTRDVFAIQLIGGGRKN